MQFLSAPLFHLPHFQLGSENASSSSKPRMAKDDYNSQGYSTDGHYQVLLIWLYLQQPEQALFQYQDSIIVQPQNEHRDWTESIFPILNLSFLTFFFFFLSEKEHLAAIHCSNYNSTFHCLEQLWVYSEVLQRTCISLSFDKPRVSEMSTHRALRAVN